MCKSSRSSVPPIRHTRVCEIIHRIWGHGCRQSIQIYVAWWHPCPQILRIRWVSRNYSAHTPARTKRQSFARLRGASGSPRALLFLWAHDYDVPWHATTALRWSNDTTLQRRCENIYGYAKRCKNVETHVPKTPRRPNNGQTITKTAFY